MAETQNEDLKNPSTNTADVKGKLSQKEANYRTKGEPGRACSACKNFQPQDSCNVVAGKIDPNGLSDMFMPAEGEQMMAAASPMDLMGA